MDAPAQSSFVRSRLPWVVAAAAFILYLVTLNRWVSLNSLTAVSSFLDAKMTPPLQAPLFYLITVPLHLLPAPLQLTGLNVLSALLGALTLALLTRSVALLPHDRTREERHRLQGGGALLNLRFAWAAPLLAAAVLGVQISFWEHATAATGEMLNLMLLAYVVRCLLEYRIDPRQSWLTRLALVYGLATTNSYAMIAYFPLVLMALIWIRGASFFQAGFIIRMTLWGAAGLLVYLIVPLIMVLQENNGLAYLKILRYELVLQYIELRSVPRLITLLAALTSVVPIFLIGIRWPSTFGDTSAFGNLLVNIAFRVIYLVFTGFILWMMLGGEFAPRAQIESMLSRSIMPIPLPAYLSFYYLAALALGYFIGYCLLVFGLPEPQRHRRGRSAPNPALQAVAALPAVAALGTTLFLAWSNAPVVRLNNGQLLKNFATRAVKALPSEPAVVLSDKPRILTLVHTLLSQQHLSDRHLLVSTRGLNNPVYQRELNRRGPHLWPDYFTGTNVQLRTIPNAALMLELTEVALKNPTYYLHPSFGYFFERVFLEPQGLIYRLHHWTTNTTVPPRISQELLQHNTEYYRALQEELAPLTSKAARTSPDARTVAKWYAQALNGWGVTLLRNAPDQHEAALEAFRHALDLNPDNRSAEINVQFAQARLSGQARSIYEGKPAEQMLGRRYRSWDQLLSIDGPIDDPAGCLSLGRNLWSTGLYRQALIELRRALELSQPDQRQASRFMLALAYSGLSQFDEVLTVAQEISEQNTQYPLPEDQLLRLFSLEAVAMRERDQGIDAAEQYLRERIAEHPGSIVLIDTLGEIYVGDQQEDKALALVDEQLAQVPSTPASSALRNPLLLSKAAVFMRVERFDEANLALEEILSKEPDHPEALAYRGYLFLTREMYTNAIPSYDRLVALRPDNILPHLNRAIALLKSGQLDAAESDYLKVLELRPTEHRAHYGLGEIAWERKDYREAAEHYEAYLKFTRKPGNQEARDVTKRLESIESGDL